MQTVKVRKVIPSVYMEDEIESLLNSFNRSSSLGIRNYAMVLIAARLGVRASDICAFTFEEIHWERNTVAFITQETGKHTVLPLIADVDNAIIKYLKMSALRLMTNTFFYRCGPHTVCRIPHHYIRLLLMRFVMPVLLSIQKDVMGRMPCGQVSQQQC